MTAAELVGQNIRRFRKAQGLKQTVLAERCGYSAKASGTISKIERGQIAIDVNVAGRIADALGVDLPVLFQAPAEPDTGAAREAVVPLEAQRLLALWHQLTVTDRQTLRRCAEVLASEETDLRQQLAGLVTLAMETLQRRRLHRGGAAEEVSEGTSAG